MQDHYAALGLGPVATSEQIKTAYRKLAAQYHPDKNSDPKAPARFRQVQEAYEILSDAGKRKAYDDFRQRCLIDDPAAVAKELAGQYLREALA